MEAGLNVAIGRDVLLVVVVHETVAEYRPEGGENQEDQEESGNGTAGGPGRGSHRQSIAVGDTVLQWTDAIWQHPRREPSVVVRVAPRPRWPAQAVDRGKTVSSPQGTVCRVGGAGRRKSRAERPNIKNFAAASVLLRSASVLLYSSGDQIRASK